MYYVHVLIIMSRKCSNIWFILPLHAMFYQTILLLLLIGGIFRFLQGFKQVSLLTSRKQVAYKLFILVMPLNVTRHVFIKQSQDQNYLDFSIPEALKETSCKHSLNRYPTHFLLQKGSLTSCKQVPYPIFTIIRQLNFKYTGIQPTFHDC